MPAYANRLLLSVIALCATLSLVACDLFSSNLTRSKAEAQLKEKVNKDKVEELVIGDSGGQLRFRCQSRQCQEPFLENRADNNAPILVKLRDAGFITIEKKIWNERLPGYFGDHLVAYSVQPTAKMSKYAKITVKPEECSVLCLDRSNKTILIIKLADLELITVTGLTEPSDAMGEKVVQAEYVAKYAPTPVSGLFLGSTDLAESRRAVFVKFDDGWRLSWNEPKIPSFEERSVNTPPPAPLPISAEQPKAPLERSTAAHNLPDTSVAAPRTLTREPQIVATGDKAVDIIRPGESRDNWTLAKNGEIKFGQQLVGKAMDPLAAQLRISQGSHNGMFRYTVLFDADKGSMEGFVWRKEANGILAKIPGPGNSDTIYWSPDGGYAIVTDGGEIQDNAYVVDLANGKVAKRQVGAPFKEGDCEVKALYGQPARWIGNSSFQLAVKIDKNAYESKCASVNARVMSVEVSLN